MSGFAIILGVYWACELFCRALHLRFPGSVLGMVVLAIALIRGWLPQQKVEGACKVLQKNIILFFLPAGVACIDYFDMIGSHFAEIAISSVLSTILVVSVAAIFYQTRRT